MKKKFWAEWVFDIWTKKEFDVITDVLCKELERQFRDKKIKKTKQYKLFEDACYKLGIAIVKNIKEN